MQFRARASPQQFATLIEFMETHGDIARPQQGPQGRIRADRLWLELGQLLNSSGGGVTRPTEKWKKVWADWKTKTKKKVSLINRETNATGGRPSSIQTLSALEQRVLGVMDLTAAVRLSSIKAPSSERPEPHPVESNSQIILEGIHTSSVAASPLKVSLSEAMKIGFIGGGRLAFALANGFISAGLAKPEEITASCHPSDVASAEAFRGLGATALFENKSVVERSEVVIVSVKPDVVAPALRELKDLAAAKNKLFISVAMGVSTGTIERVLPHEARVIRVMPNTPALVQQGAAALARGARATPDDARRAAELFRAVGSCEEVPEYQMDAVTALSGSGPAYVYMMIEALAEGGVRCGLPRDLALRLAAQTALGAAAMLKDGGHPAVMKDNVTSPAGSTAEGTYHLEKNGFRAAVIGAVAAARDRCRVVNEQLNI